MKITGKLCFHIFLTNDVFCYIEKIYHYLTSDIAFDIIWLDGWLYYHVFRSIQQRFSNQKRNT